VAKAIFQAGFGNYLRFLSIIMNGNASEKENNGYPLPFPAESKSWNDGFDGQKGSDHSAANFRLAECASP
jgi:hypothetical protein